MDIHQLRIFLAVSESLNFSRVAEQCYTSRQSIRYSIRNLEQELQTQLIETNNNKLVLTPKGEELAIMARNAIGSLRQLQTDFTEGGNEETQVLTVCIDSSVLTEHEVLGSFFNYLQQNGVEDIALVEDRCDYCLERVRKREADLAYVRFDSNSFLDCDSRTINTMHFAVLLNEKNPLAQKDTIKLNDLCGQRFIARPGYEKKWDTFIKQCKAQNIDINPDLVINSSRLAVDLLTENIGIILTATYKSEKRLLEGGLMIVPIAAPNLTWYDSLVYHRQSINRHTVALVESFFKEHKLSSIPDLLWAKK